MISVEDFIKKTRLNDGAVLLEDWDTFSKGIVGVTPDRNHVMYSYEKLSEALKDLYMKSDVALDEEEAESMAWEWLDYNTIPVVDQLPIEFRPVIVYETENSISFNAYESSPVKNILVA